MREGPGKGEKGQERGKGCLWGRRKAKENVAQGQF